jgi:hypothetical protein
MPVSTWASSIAVRSGGAEATRTSASGDPRPRPQLRDLHPMQLMLPQDQLVSSATVRATRGGACWQKPGVEARRHDSGVQSAVGVIDTKRGGPRNHRRRPLQASGCRRSTPAWAASHERPRKQRIRPRLAGRVSFFSLLGDTPPPLGSDRGGCHRPPWRTACPGAVDGRDPQTSPARRRRPWPRHTTPPAPATTLVEIEEDAHTEVAIRARPAK